MKMLHVLLSLGISLLSNMAMAQNDVPDSSVFSYDQSRLGESKPWTTQDFQDDPNEFQFLVIGDRTGGANVQGTFNLAIDQINLLQPEFVINVGDNIEGYSDDKAELNAELDELDEMLARLNMRFFRTPGNHDIANETAQALWRERYGTTYYDFTYKDVLFLVLDSEDPPRVPPEGIKEKLHLYKRLQVEDPAKAQELLAEFMSDEAVIAGLGKPVEFNDAQRSFVEQALKRHPDVRWTFVFLHEPAWENPSDSFKAIQGLLKGRKHTFIGGHLHYYDYDNIDGVEHITMGPSGASFHKDGPGNVDHVMWVTMTEDGPEIANIALKGIFDRKGLDPELFGAYDRKGYPPAESSEEKK
jgi:hypothetical protein